MNRTIGCARFGNEVRFYGHSDDLVVVAGEDTSDEFGLSGNDTASFVVISGGRVAVVEARYDGDHHFSLMHICGESFDIRCGREHEYSSNIAIMSDDEIVVLQLAHE